MMIEVDCTGMLEIDSGRIKAALDLELQKMIEDCEDRPLVTKDRVVTLKIKLKPVCNDTTMESVDVSCEINGKVPVRATNAYNMRARKRAGHWSLVYNDLSKDNVNQRTLDEVFESRE